MLGNYVSPLQGPETYCFYMCIPQSVHPSVGLSVHHKIMSALQLVCRIITVKQGSHRLEKYLNLEGFLEKSLKIKTALKSTGKSLKSLEKSLNSTIFCRTQHC